MLRTMHSAHLFLLLSLHVATAVAAPDALRQRELVRLVRQDCGSCHGMRLQGGLGPALLPEALADKPADALKYTVLLGRSGTPMPGWRVFVNEAEAEWIVTRLQSGFPTESTRPDIIRFEESP